MKISISFATIRYGWLENTFRCLGQQTLPHNEWKLIMIDDTPEDRSEQVIELAKKENINIKWMRSKKNYWKFNRMLGNARNTGFVHSDGELIVFLDDYTWIPPTFLEEHWKIYKQTKNAVIGRVKAVTYKDNIKDSSELEVIGEDNRYEQILSKGNSYLQDAPYAWFYTFNSSAPLANIIKINGFDEEFDCTGEDDIDLGERLSRIGTKFTYRTHSGITIFHTQHGKNIIVKCNNCNANLGEYHCWYDRNTCPNCKTPVNMHDINKMIRFNITPRYKENDVHKVTKDLYGTKYEGSWGLLERNKRKNPWNVNNGYFNLSDARKNRDFYPYKEYKI